LNHEGTKITKADKRQISYLLLFVPFVCFVVQFLLIT